MLNTIPENLKLSFYTIFTESFNDNRYRLVYSTSSTSLLLIEAKTYSHLINNEFDSIDSSLLNQLIESNILVFKDKDELLGIISKNQEVIANNKNLFQVIAPSANCQLGCGYCGQVHSKGEMDQELNSKVLERIESNLSKRKYEGLQIGWFGAEPLMGLKNIRNLSESLIKLANKNNCSYSAKMVTNGLSLKKRIFYEMLEDYKVNNFEITLDGTQEFHDNRRHTKLFKKTFDLIIKNLKDITSDSRFAGSNCTINIRCNVDRSNYKNTYNLIDYLDGEDILNKVSFYTAPIHSWGNDAHLSSLTHEEYADFQIDSYIYLLEKGHPMVLLPGKKKHIVCTSLHDDAEVFDSSGNVYNCTEISQVPAYENEDSYVLKNLNESSLKPGSEHKERAFTNWNEEILNDDIPCSTCKILPICGGACPKLWKENISPCPALKENIKDRMFLEFGRNRKILQTI